MSTVPSDLFSQFESLKFFAKNIFTDKNITIIEFSLILNEKTLQGVDIIEWNVDGKIKEL